MITVIITAFKEPKTIGKAIEAVERQNIGEHETLVVAPDEETLVEAYKMKRYFKSVKTLKDYGNGKSAALNLAISKARGEVLILTDGDVSVGENSLVFLLEKMRNQKVGAVSGRPVSVDSKKTMYGFWAYLLTGIAHNRRMRALKTKRRFFCSGYLFAIRKNLFPKLPEQLLSEDGFISHGVYSKGYKIEYAEKAKVYVRYPDNFSDWIKQKKRSAGGYNQIRGMIGVEIRSAKKEWLGGFEFFKYVHGLKEVWWLVLLFLSRIYLWGVIYKDVNIKKKKREELWERVESTK